MSAVVAQLGERETEDLKVTSSILVRGIIFIKFNQMFQTPSNSFSFYTACCNLSATPQLYNLMVCKSKVFQIVVAELQVF